MNGIRKIIKLASLVIAAPIAIPFTQIFTWIMDGEWLPLSFWRDFFDLDDL